MPTGKKFQHHAVLRRRAEAQATAMEYQYPATLSPEEARRLLHELRVHQIELELQNEGLRQKLAELERSRARYFDLYNTAPVGLVTLNEKGAILGLNPCAAALLGMARGAKVNRPFGRFILPEDRHLYYRHRRQLVKTGEPQACDVRLAPRDVNAPVTWAHLEMALAQDEKQQASACSVVLSDVTERKQLETILWTNEARLHALIDNTDGNIWSVDRDYRLLVASAAFHRYLQRYAGRELVPGDSVLDPNRPDINAFWKTAYERVFAGEHIRQEIASQYNRSGAVIECALSPILDASGAVTGAVGFMRDITERVRAAEALAEARATAASYASEQRLGAIIEQSSAGVAQADVDGRLLHVNDRFCEIVGYSPEELLGRRFQEIMDPEDAYIDKLAVAALLRDGKSGMIEKRYRRKDGRRVWVNLSAALTRDAAGKPLHIVAVVLDITQHKLIEESLQQSEGQLRLAIDSASLGTWHWNLVTGELLWSGACLALFGLPPDTEMTYQRFLDALHPDDREAVDRGTRTALEAHSDYGMDYRTCWPDGSVHWLRALGRGFYSADGAPLRMEGVLMDIDEQVAVQTALKESNERLHQLAAHIEALREEERTRISRELHDELGQMLTAIKMDVALLSKQIVQQRPVDCQLAISELDTIQELMNQAISTVRKIALELRPGVFDRLGLVEGMRWQAEELQRRSGIRCELDLAAHDIPLSEPQEIALFRIFQEILTNISRHAGADSVSVFLGLKGGRVNLLVRDNGQGITGEQQTAASSLGLLGMRERVRMLGGTLEISGQEGIGTTVEVFLPLEGNEEKPP